MTQTPQTPQDGKTPIQQYASVYTIECCFGGHEEGGWYYDWYTRTTISIPIAFEEDIDDAYEQAKQLARDKEGLSFKDDELDFDYPAKVPSHRSMSRYAANAVVIVEDSQWENESTQTPHYE